MRYPLPLPLPLPLPNEVCIDRPLVIYLPELGLRRRAASGAAVRRTSASQAVPLIFDHTRRPEPA